MPGGRPRYVVNETDARIVRALAIGGLPSERIAEAIGVSPVTVRKYYRDELTIGVQKAHAAVIGKLFENCMKGKEASIFFWLKTRLGWREKLDIQIAAESLPAIEIQPVAPISLASPPILLQKVLNSETNGTSHYE